MSPRMAIAYSFLSVAFATSLGVSALFLAWNVYWSLQPPIQTIHRMWAERDLLSPGEPLVIHADISRTEQCQSVMIHRFVIEAGTGRIVEATIAPPSIYLIGAHQQSVNTIYLDKDKVLSGRYRYRTNVYNSGCPSGRSYTALSPQPDVEFTVVADP